MRQAHEPELTLKSEIRRIFLIFRTVLSFKSSQKSPRHRPQDLQEIPDITEFDPKEVNSFYSRSMVDDPSPTSNFPQLHKPARWPTARHIRNATTAILRKSLLFPPRATHYQNILPLGTKKQGTEPSAKRLRHDQFFSLFTQDRPGVRYRGAKKSRTARYLFYFLHHE